jgi:hypothetical protein
MDEVGMIDEINTPPRITGVPTGNEKLKPV